MAGSNLVSKDRPIAFKKSSVVRMFSAGRAHGPKPCWKVAGSRVGGDGNWACLLTSERVTTETTDDRRGTSPRCKLKSVVAIL